jgi:hypothetical protein
MNTVSCLPRVCRLASCVFLLLVFLVSAGCGNPTGSVYGKVTFEGNPLPSGNVSFAPENNTGAGTKGAVVSPIAEDGSYSVSNLPVGKVTITVETRSGAPPAAPPGAKMNAPAGAPNYAAPGAKHVDIPERYSQFDKSGLSYEVKSGRQSHDIQLTTK